MAYKMGDAVRIKDIRDRTDYPHFMTMMSGQVGHIVMRQTVRMMGGEERIYYELDTDAGKGLWPEDFLEPYATPKSDKDEQEWIDTVLKLIAEIEGKLDTLKRLLWRKKHYGDR